MSGILDTIRRIAQKKGPDDFFPHGECDYPVLTIRQEVEDYVSQLIVNLMQNEIVGYTQDRIKTVLRYPYPENIAFVARLEALSTNPNAPGNYSMRKLMEKVRDEQFFIIPDPENPGCVCINSTDPDYVIDFLIHMTFGPEKLTGLNLGGSGIGDEKLVKLLAQPAIANLRSLSLEHCKLGSRGIAEIGRCPYLSNLRRLSLNCNNLKEGATAFIARSKYLKKLQELDLRFTGLEEREIEELQESEIIALLKSLDLRNNFLSQKTAKALAKVDFSFLRTLSVDASDLGSDGIASIARNPTFYCLEHLNAGRNAISDKGVDGFCDGNFPALTALDFSYNPVRSPGMKRLITSPNIPKLQVLTLKGCTNSTSEMVDCIARTKAEGQTGIQVVDLRGVNISDMDMYDLTQSDSLRHVHLSTDPKGPRISKEALILEVFGKRIQSLEAENRPDDLVNVYVSKRQDD